MNRAEVMIVIAAITFAKMVPDTVPRIIIASVTQTYLAFSLTRGTQDTPPGREETNTSHNNRRQESPHRRVGRVRAYDTPANHRPTADPPTTIPTSEEDPTEQEESEDSNSSYPPQPGENHTTRRPDNGRSLQAQGQTLKEIRCLRIASRSIRSEMADMMHKLRECEEEMKDIPPEGNVRHEQTPEHSPPHPTRNQDKGRTHSTTSRPPPPDTRAKEREEINRRERIQSNQRFKLLVEALKDAAKDTQKNERVPSNSV